MLKQLSVAAVAGLAAAQNTPSLAAALNSTSELSSLSSLVPPSILQSLSAAQNITLLAPSNEAFGKIPAKELSALSSNSAFFNAFLQYHVLNGTYLASAIPQSGVFVPTLLTDKAYTNVTGGQVVEAVAQDNTVVFYSGGRSNSTATKANVNFTGGVIHIIDNFLTVPGSISDTANATGLTALLAAVQQANLVDTVNYTPDLTVFAPTNEAFESIASLAANISVAELSSILTYHVVAGTVGYSTKLTNGTSLKTVNGQSVTVTVGSNGIFVNNAKVVISDVLVANGVAHVIDQVLNPSNTTAADPNSQTAGVPAYSGATSTTGGNSSTNTTRPGLPQATSNTAASTSTGAVGLSALLAAAAVYFL